MADLPEIPDDAWDAAAAALVPMTPNPETRTVPEQVADAFGAAWPHLYATALRHAADRLAGTTWDPWKRASHALERLADEATPR